MATNQVQVSDVIKTLKSLQSVNQLVGDLLSSSIEILESLSDNDPSTTITAISNATSTFFSKYTNIDAASFATAVQILLNLAYVTKLLTSGTSTSKSGSVSIGGQTMKFAIGTTLSFDDFQKYLGTATSQVAILKSIKVQ